MTYTYRAADQRPSRMPGYSRLSVEERREYHASAVRDHRARLKLPADPTPRVPLDSRLRAHVRGNRSCWYCLRPFMSGELIQVEHVFPLARGGSNERRNLRAACAACNRAKHAKTYGWVRPPRTDADWRKFNRDVRNGVRRDRGLPPLFTSETRSAPTTPPAAARSSMTSSSTPDYLITRGRPDGPMTPQS